MRCAAGHRPWRRSSTNTMRRAAHAPFGEQVVGMIQRLDLAEVDMAEAKFSCSPPLLRSCLVSQAQPLSDVRKPWSRDVFA